MVIKSIRDAEIQIKVLLDRIANLEAKNGTAATKSTTTTIVKTENVGVRNLLAELNINADSTVLEHQAKHIFRNIVDIFANATVHGSLGLTEDGFELGSGGTNILNLTHTLGTQFELTAGATGTFRHWYNQDPANDNNVDLGSSTKRYKEIFSYLLDVSTTATLAHVVSALIDVTDINVAGGNLTMSSLTASRPLKLDASKHVISALISLTSEVSGTLPVGNGGTGATSFTANMPLLGNGASAFSQPATVFSGTFYVSGISGGATTVAKTVANGIITS